MYPISIILTARSNDTRQLVERELSSLQARIDHDYPGFSDCLASLEISEHELKLFIVEVHSEDDIHSLAKLNDRFTGFPILALVHVSSAPGLLISAMRAGAAQVVRVPLDSRDFEDAMKRVATQFGHAPKPCDVVAVVAADQGAGVSSVSINLGAELARQSDGRCLLIEASTTYGHLADQLNITPRITTFDLLDGSHRLDRGLLQQAITRVDGNFGVIAGPFHTIHEDGANILGLLPVQQLAQEICDHLVIDISSDFDHSLFEYLTSVDQLIIVGEQRVSSVTGIRALLLKLEERGISARKIVVINKYDRSRIDMSAAALQKLLELPELMTIRKDDKLFYEAEDSGKTLRQLTVYHSIHKDFEKLAHFILRKKLAEEQTGFFSRMFLSTPR